MNRGTKNGFTLIEVMTASSVSMVVVGGVMAVFLWIGVQINQTQRVSWSHAEALDSSRSVLCYLRGATGITAADTNDWRWVEVGRPDGSTSRVVYAGPIEGQRDGSLYLTNSTGKVTVLARGITEIMSEGFSVPVFRLTGPNYLRVSYQVVQPIDRRPGTVQTSGLGAIVDTGVCLRNAPQ